MVEIKRQDKTYIYIYIHCYTKHNKYIFCETHEKGPYAIWGQRRPRLFAQADLGLSCPLTESMDTVDQTARMRMLIWTFAVRI